MLMVNNLVGFGAGGAASASAVMTDSAKDNSQTATYTFSGKSVGVTASRTHVGVFVVLATDNARAISSVTIGGNAATLVSGSQGTTTYERFGFYVYALTTGTTADIVVTPAATDANMVCEIAVYALYGASASASSQTSATGSGTTISGTLTIPAGGVAMAYAYGGGITGTASWNVGTEDLDTTSTDPFFTLQSSAMHTTISTGSTTMTCTFSSSAGRSGLSAVTYGPVG